MTSVTRVRVLEGNRWQDISKLIETAYPNGVQMLNANKLPSGSWYFVFCLPQNIIDHQVTSPNILESINQIENLDGETGIVSTDEKGFTVKKKGIRK